MKDFYDDAGVQFERPGGFEITERGITICRFAPHSKLADIGCGGGYTARYLANKYGFSVIGVDINPRYAASGGICEIICGDAMALPFPDESLDGLIFECSMSKTEQPDAVLNECARVLKPGGKLMVTDLYARGIPAVLKGRLNRLEGKDNILNRIAIFGFDLLHFEDFSKKLISMWAQLVFENGEDVLCDEFCTDTQTLKRIKCGYFLAVFQKAAESVSRVDRHSAAILGADVRMTPGDLRDRQLSAINDMLPRALESDYYREKLSGTSTKLQSISDFECLPFTEARDLSDDYSRFLTVSPGDVRRIVTRRTSGTTGGEKRLSFTGYDIARTEDFFTYALSDYVKSGDKAAVFLSNTTRDGIGDLLYRAFRRIGVDTFIHGIIVNFEEAAERFEGFDFFVGTPAQMLRLCRMSPSLAPGTVLLSADYIPDSVLNAIETGWNTRVLRHFGMTETCFGCAVDCACVGGQHIRHGDFYIEIVDPVSGRTVPDGQLGEIVLTTLRSEAFPMIRYKTGDLGSLETGICSCGGVLPRLGKVHGRLGNLASQISIHRLDELMFSLDGVLDYHAQLSGGKLTLYIDGEPINPSAIERELGVEVAVEYRKAEPWTGKRMLTESLGGAMSEQGILEAPKRPSDGWVL